VKAVADSNNPTVYEQLESYFMTQRREITQQVKRATVRHARNLRENLKCSSPVDTSGQYAREHRVYRNGWRVSTTESIYAIECVVHQYRRPYLTWLLENGHLLQDGTRTRAQPHIYPNGERELDRWFLDLSTLDLWTESDSTW
jgi:hypothetical protein